MLDYFLFVNYHFYTPQLILQMFQTPTKSFGGNLKMTMNKKRLNSI